MCGLNINLAFGLFACKQWQSCRGEEGQVQIFGGKWGKWAEKEGKEGMNFKEKGGSEFRGNCANKFWKIEIFCAPGEKS